MPHLPQVWRGGAVHNIDKCVTKQQFSRTSRVVLQQFDRTLRVRLQQHHRTSRVLLQQHHCTSRILLQQLKQWADLVGKAVGQNFQGHLPYVAQHALATFKRWDSPYQLLHTHKWLSCISQPAAATHCWIGVCGLHMAVWKLHMRTVVCMPHSTVQIFVLTRCALELIYITLHGSRLMQCTGDITHNAQPSLLHREQHKHAIAREYQDRTSTVARGY